jgi:hypothetical protein
MQRGILNVSLEEMISNAVVASWGELMLNDGSPLAHVEYHRAAPDNDVQYLKMWTADGTGGWQLVCQYWVSTQGQESTKGLTFCSPFYSVNFARSLIAVLENQGMFSDLQEQTRDGLIQISWPTDDQRAAASQAIQTALSDRHLCAPRDL